MSASYPKFIFKYEEWSKVVPEGKEAGIAKFKVDFLLLMIILAYLHLLFKGAVVRYKVSSNESETVKVAKNMPQPIGGFQHSMTYCDIVDAKI